MVAQELKNVQRRLGTYPTTESGAAAAHGRGPLLVVIAGLHGNEPAGVVAARRVLAELRSLAPRMRGRVVALAGNTRALERSERFASRDLNRVWTDDEVERCKRHAPAERDHEAREQHALLGEIEPLLAEDWERVVLLDLHSTSADGSPFAIMADTLRNRAFGSALGVPVMLGLEEWVEGTLLSYYSERGHTAVCLEGGQNELASTVDHHVAAIWITLVAGKLVARDDVPRYDEFERLLRDVTWGLPRVVEMRHRESVQANTSFAMNPGYTNFHRVVRGEVLAHIHAGDAAEPVRSPLDGWLFMPRYQGQGDDAFFIADEVRPWQLAAGAWLRRLRLEWTLRLMPGIRRDPTAPRAFCVDVHRVGRITLAMLHAFGYRRATRDGGRAVFIRRP